MQGGTEELHAITELQLYPVIPYGAYRRRQVCDVHEFKRQVGIGGPSQMGEIGAAEFEGLSVLHDHQ